MTLASIRGKLTFVQYAVMTLASIRGKLTFVQRSLIYNEMPESNLLPGISYFLPFGLIIFSPFKLIIFSPFGLIISRKPEFNRIFLYDLIISGRFTINLRLIFVSAKRLFNGSQAVYSPINFSFYPMDPFRKRQGLLTTSATLPPRRRSMADCLYI